MAWIPKHKLAALQQEKDALQADLLELKGYFENRDKEKNKYFASISSLLTGNEISDMFNSIDRAKLKEVYEGCGPAFGIINKIARAVGDCFTYLELQNINTGDYVEKHWILDLLRRPNDRYNCRRFGTAWAVTRLTYGDAFTYAPPKLGKNYGECEEMYLLPGHHIKIEKGGYRNPLKGIAVTGGSKEELIEPREFFESFAFNLDDTSFFGFSPLIAAALYLSIIDRGMRREDASLKNGGPASIITPAKDNMGVMPKDKDAVEEEFNKRENVGKTHAFRVPIEVHEIGSKSVDLGILDSHKEAVTALCFAYDIPVDLYYGQAKYENAKEAKKALFENNAIPLANEFAADLLAHFGLDQEFTLTVNTDLIDVLKDDAADVLDNLAKMHASLNELREANGYDPRPEPWADLPMLPMAIQFGGEGITDINESEEEEEGAEA